MPRSPLWCFTLVSDHPKFGVYVKYGESVLSKYGKVEQIKPCKENGRESYIKVCHVTLIISWQRLSSLHELCNDFSPAILGFKA